MNDVNVNVNEIYQSKTDKDIEFLINSFAGLFYVPSKKQLYEYAREKIDNKHMLFRLIDNTIEQIYKSAVKQKFLHVKTMNKAMFRHIFNIRNDLKDIIECCEYIIEYFDKIKLNNKNDPCDKCILSLLHNYITMYESLTGQPYNKKLNNKLN